MNGSSAPAGIAGDRTRSREETALNPAERTVLLLVPLAVAGAEVAGLFVAGSVPPHRALNPFYNNIFLTGAAGFIALCLLRRRDLPAFLLLGTAIEVARLLVARVLHVPFGTSLMASGLGYWLAALAIESLHLVQASGRRRAVAFDRLLTQFALPAGIALTFFGNSLVRNLTPVTFDAYLYAFDGLFPVPAAQLLADWCRGDPVASLVLGLTYHSLFGMFGALLLLERHFDNHAGKFAARVMLVGLVGFFLYFIVPGVGPDVAFHARHGAALPDPSRIELAPMPMSPEQPRNAMPSLHKTYAFVILIVAAGFGAGWFVLAGLFAAGTVLATLGLREHYLVDLVVAIPLALASCWFLGAFDHAEALRRSWLRRAAIAAAMALGWLACVRFGTGALRGAPWVASALVLATLAMAAWIGVPPVRKKLRASYAVPDAA